jgi:uncharacterized protein (UPF0335 family)
MIKAKSDAPKGKGHNSGPVIADRLKSFVDRIERVAEEIKGLQGDVKDIYSEAKAIGYDVATMRKVIRLRGMDAADRAEEETLLDVYLHALGMTMGNAVREVMAGAGVRATAEKYDVSRTALSRSVPKSDDAPILGTPSPSTQTPTDREHGGIDPVPEKRADEPTSVRDAGAPAVTSADGLGVTTITESCGPCPVPTADAATETASDEGESSDSPAARRHTSDDALAPAMGTTQREDRASPGPQDATLPLLAPEREAVASTLPCASAWQHITAPVLEQLAAEEAVRAEREAERERKRAERLALAERNRQIDADPLDIPPFLKARAPVPA